MHECAIVESVRNISAFAMWHWIRFVMLFNRDDRFDSDVWPAPHWIHWIFCWRCRFIWFQCDHHGSMTFVWRSRKWSQLTHFNGKRTERMKWTKGKHVFLSTFFICLHKTRQDFPYSNRLIARMDNFFLSFRKFFLFLSPRIRLCGSWSKCIIVQLHFQVHHHDATRLNRWNSFACLLWSTIITKLNFIERFIFICLLLLAFTLFLLVLGASSLVSLVVDVAVNLFALQLQREEEKGEKKIVDRHWKCARRANAFLRLLFVLASSVLFCFSSVRFDSFEEYEFKILEN